MPNPTELTKEEYDHLMGIKTPAKKSSSKSDPYSKITSYGYKKGVKNASKYSDQEWRDFAKTTGFKGGTNEEFQDYLWNHPKYGPLVQSLHAPDKLGMPKSGKYNEGYLGARFDVVKEAIDSQNQEPQQTDTQVSANQIVTNTGDKNTPVRNLYDGYNINTPNKVAKPEWWLQDVINTAGAASDFARIKKRLPWASPVSPVVTPPTFYDPTRELGQNTEMANIGVQGANAYGNPQSYAATFSGIQGKAAENAASILGKYNNMNVTVANDFAARKDQTLNNANQLNAGIAKTLFDETTMANDNFDKAKNMARQELRQSYVSAVTNRANAQVLNTIYPNYQISPMQAGQLKFYKGDKLTGKSAQSQAEADQAYIDAMMTKYPGSNAIDWAKHLSKQDVTPDYGYIPGRDYPQKPK